MFCLLSRNSFIFVFVLSLFALSLTTRTLWLRGAEKAVTNVTVPVLSKDLLVVNFSTSQETIQPFQQSLKNFVLPERFTKNDRISPTDFKRESDFHFSSGLAKAEVYTALGDPASVKSSSVIFCDSPGLRVFAEQVAPKINVSFVLLTGDSDASMPGIFVDQAKTVLSGPFMKHW